MTFFSVDDFLLVKTPTAWLQMALTQLPLLLIDHAHCEKKAASTALNLMYRYVDRHELLIKMAQLAREELLNFEQVLGLLQVRGITYDHLPPSTYAGLLHQHVAHFEPWRLIDTLILGALIEARSCERFAALAAVLADHELAQYYRFLLKSESRHFEDYLALARLYAPEQGKFDFDQRLNEWREREALLITRVDPLFRFHSGVPVDVVVPVQGVVPV